MLYSAENRKKVANWVEFSNSNSYRYALLTDIVNMKPNSIMPLKKPIMMFAGYLAEFRILPTVFLSSGAPSQIQ